MRALPAFLVLWSLLFAGACVAVDATTVSPAPPFARFTTAPTTLPIAPTATRPATPTVVPTPSVSPTPTVEPLPELVEYMRFEEGAFSLAFSPDSERVAVAYFETRLIDAATGDVIWTFLPPIEDQQGILAEYAVAFSPDGAYLATGGQEEILYLLNTDDAAISARFSSEGRSSTISKIIFSPDGQYVAVGSCGEGPGLSAWNVATGEEVLHIWPYGTCSFAIDSENTLYLPRSGGPVQTIPLISDASHLVTDDPEVGAYLVWHISISPDGDLIAAITSDRERQVWLLRFWSGGREIELLDWRRYIPDPLAAEISPSGNYLAVLDYGGDIVVFDLGSRRPVAHAFLPDADGFGQIQFSRDEQFFAVYGPYGSPAIIWQFGDP